MTEQPIEKMKLAQESETLLAALGAWRNSKRNPTVHG